MTRVVLLLSVVGSALALLSCSSAPCPAGAEHDRIIQANHISGGEAPTIDSLEVYKNGLLRLNHVGSRIFCSKASEQQVSALSTLADPGLVEKTEWTIAGVHDAEWAQIFVDGAETRVLLRPPPQDLVPLLRALDTLFTEHFGRHYDTPFLPE